jgi:hypothetical protein
MTYEKGWLEAQFNQVAEGIKTWPYWMVREAGFKDELERREKENRDEQA